MKLPIIYEDECLVVIDKPVGVVANRAETVETETLQDWMEEHYRISRQEAVTENELYFRERHGLVHRLDKETSGVIVLAKTVDCFIELLRQFKEREVTKSYAALTHGIWQVPEGEINLPLGRTRFDRKKFGVREDGRVSTTRYKVVREFRHWELPKIVNDRGYGGFSLVEFFPKTGRTHQIRVHAKHMGHPLVGDFLYAGRKRSREDRKWATRLMLHARSLEFTHPGTKERVRFTADSGSFEDILTQLAD